MGFMASTMLSFSPRQFFGSEEGVCYDPSDLSTLWQDAQGTTAVTGVEQSVGLILDKRNGRGLGTELVTNSTFATDTDWTKGTGWSIGSGVATKSAGSASVLSQAVSLTAGFTYRLVYTITRSAGSITPQFTGGSTVAGTARSAAGTYVQLLTAVSGNTTLEFSADASFAGTVDNVYLKRTSGNDAWQITSAARPVLSARYNLLTKTEAFNDAAWTTDNTSVSANAATDPLGGSTADRLSEGTGSGRHIIYVNYGSTVSSLYTVTIHAKYENCQYVVLGLDATAITRVYFDLVNGTVTDQSNATGTITDVGSGWYRLTMTGTVSQGAALSYPQLGMSDRSTATGTLSNSMPSYTGTSRTVLIWGADFRFSDDSANLPAYQRVNTSTDYDTNGFLPYLRFDGTDDCLQLTSFSLPLVERTTMAAFVEVAANANRGLISVYPASGNDYDSKGGYIFGPLDRTSSRFGANGSTSSNYLAAWTTSVASRIGRTVAVEDKTSGAGYLRINGSQVGSDTSFTEFDANSSGGLLICARWVSSAILAGYYLNGRVYGIIIRGARSNTGQIADAEGWLNSRIRAY